VSNFIFKDLIQMLAGRRLNIPSRYQKEAEAGSGEDQPARNIFG